VRLFLAAAAGLAVCSPALGAQVATTLAVGGGSLSMPDGQGGITIASIPKASKDWRRIVRRISVTVADRRGTGTGWGLTLRAGLRGRDDRRVPGASASVWRVAVRCAGMCTRPRGAGVVPVRIDERTPSRIIVARSRSGMGVLRLRISVAVTVPAGSPAGPYVLLPHLARTSGP
jgi:hypothetical protein